MHLLLIPFMLFLYQTKTDTSTKIVKGDNYYKMIKVDVYYNHKKISLVNSDLVLVLESNEDSLRLLNKGNDSCYINDFFKKYTGRSSDTAKTALIIRLKKRAHTIILGTSVFAESPEWLIEINSYPFWKRKKLGKYEVNFTIPAYSVNQIEF